jgi:ribonuclease R
MKSSRRAVLHKKEDTSKNQNPEIVPQTIICALEKSGSGWLAVPVSNSSKDRESSSRLSKMVWEIPKSYDIQKSFKQGHFILLKWDQKKHHILDFQYLGGWESGALEADIALLQNKIPTSFSEKTLQEAQSLPNQTEISSSLLNQRRDLRSLAFVTIDGEDAKDFDDAVYAEVFKTDNGRASGNHKLWVAIADVAHYVKVGGAMDVDAILRGTSVYFPRRVIPMLPEAISNGLCSLRPHEDKLVIVCEMDVSAYGNVKNFQFYEAVIRSRERLTYERVQDYLDGGSSTKENFSQDVLSNLNILHKVFNSLLKQREKRGAIHIETQETRFVFNEENVLEKLENKKRYESHRLIEECMLAANVCAAKWIKSQDRSLLYRIHEEPSEKKVAAFNEVLIRFNFDFRLGIHPQTKDFLVAAQKFGAHPLAFFLNTQLLKTQMQASYSPNNIGHFGLAYTDYTHFTSPIRRYPDLLVHRVIKSLIAGEVYQPSLPQKLEKELEKSFDVTLPIDQWAKFGVITSMAERRAEDASRKAAAILKCLYAKKHEGEVFEAYVVSVLSFGFFVRLSSFDIEGLVHISTLPGYFLFDESKAELVRSSGRRTFKRKNTDSKKNNQSALPDQTSFYLGKKIWVRLVLVNPWDQKIDFILAKSPVES